MKAIITIILTLTVLSYILYRFFDKVSKNNFKDKKEATGKITNILDNGAGTIIYYATILVDEVKLAGQSIHYISTDKDYSVDDVVLVNYNTLSNNRAEFAIIDNGLSIYTDHYKKLAKILHIVSIAFTTLTALCLVKYIVM